MRPKTYLKSLMVAGAAIALSTAGPAAIAGATPTDQANGASQSSMDVQAITVADIEQAASAGNLKAPPRGGWDTPSNRGFQIQSSCRNYTSAIRQGADAWAGLSEGGDTPVYCQNSYISNCGSGGRIVGCNYGHGQRIVFYFGGVGQDTLLAAHEFGHDWYGHSNYRCASFDSPAHVMAPTLCG